jgi:hypothetical protein
VSDKRPGRYAQTHDASEIETVRSPERTPKAGRVSCAPDTGGAGRGNYGGSALQFEIVSHEIEALPHVLRWRDPACACGAEEGEEAVASR